MCGSFYKEIKLRVAVNTELGFLSGLSTLNEKSNKIQAYLNFKTQTDVKKELHKIDSKWIRHKIKKKKTTNIKDSPDLNITKNFTCTF
jgi:hypothetical protein